MLFNLIYYFYNIYSLYQLYHLKSHLSKPYSQIESLQLKKLKRLLHHACHNVDYYHQLFKQAGILPEDIKSLSDLKKIPITSKETLQSLPKEKLIAKNTDHNNLFNLRTSGSTGMPLDIWISKKEYFLRSAYLKRMCLENGTKYSDRIVVITAPNYLKLINLYSRNNNPKIKYLSIFDDLNTQVKSILEFNPQIIRGFSSSIRDLAQELKERQINTIKPKAIFTVGEILTRKDRELIESIFHTEVFDYYSANECGLIAWECKRHNGYHINSDSVIVEILKEDGTPAGSEEEGEVVITSLDSYTMPFIRYRLSDIAIASDEKCFCSINFPLMKMIAGRDNDCIILTDNRKISSYVLMIVMDRIREIKKYQIIQESKNKIVINIYQNDTISNETIIKIRKEYEKVLNKDIQIDIAIVKDVPLERKDKFKVIISKPKYITH